MRVCVVESLEVFSYKLGDNFFRSYEQTDVHLAQCHGSIVIIISGSRLATSIPHLLHEMQSVARVTFSSFPCCDLDSQSLGGST